MDFQTIILNLQKYWANQGCIMAQPYDVEKGAGTMNPSTFLRVLGPEPWNVCYVEPSRRPADGRYGDNPNRLYQHHQFQVIMQPSPSNIQELYLESLRELGIHPEEHDIRFVEDNWESPTLGAWGMGWEVWLDGMEITQFTYFQQVGSIDIKPVAVEITLWPWETAGHVTSRGWETSTTSSGWGCDLRGMCSTPTKWNSPGTALTSLTSTCCSTCSTSTKRKPNGSSSPATSVRLMTMC